MISPVLEDPTISILEPWKLGPSSWAPQESVEREPSELPSTFLLETEHRVRNDFLEDPWKETCSPQLGRWLKAQTQNGKSTYLNKG